MHSVTTTFWNGMPREFSRCVLFACRLLQCARGNGGESKNGEELAVSVCVQGLGADEKRTPVAASCSSRWLRQPSPS